MDQPSFEEVLFTTRAMRRLRPDPIPEQELRFVIEAATQAASGQNTQPWSFVVVTDPGLRRQIGAVYLEIAERAVRPGAEGSQPMPEAMRKVYAHAYRFAPRFGDAPALVVCCMNGPRPAELSWSATYYGSIFPAIQNLMLAARYRGLGTVLTTLHLAEEARIKSILGIPADVDTVAIIPLGYPEGKWARPLRRPAREVTHWDRWGQADPAASGGVRAAASEAASAPASAAAELADRLEILDVLHRYAELIDERRWDRLEEVFTPDATVDYTSTGGQKGALQPVMAWLARALAPWPLNLHFISNARIEVRGAEATSRCYFHAPMGRREPDGSQHVVTNAGCYRDRLVRTPRGWRIRERICEQVLMVGRLPEGYRIPE
jgi:nitroreductase/3-phenylpropionate/cinnamic acid dioxygenase small subunit